MANDYRVILSGEDRLSGTIRNVRNELNGTSKSATKLDELTRKFTRIQSSAAPLTKKLRELKMVMADMNLNGLTDTGVFSEMAQQAGAYSDALGDASTAIRQFADDNMTLNSVVQGMQLVTATAGALTGAMGMLGIENENVNNAILKVQSALTVLNSLQTIANVLNKDSALMLQLQALATTGATVTTTSFTAALSKAAIVEALATAKTKISTIAQTAWNVAKAIGMAMLGNFTGLALLAVGAIVGVTMATKSDTEATEADNASKEKLATTTEYLTEKQIEAGNKINEEAGKLVASYKGLQTQFNSLGSDVEKAKWLEENKNKFQQLGFSVDNVTAAEDFFGKSSSKVIESLKARAKAAAMYQLYLEALQKQYELNHQKSVHYEWNYKGDVGGEDYNRKKQQAYQAAIDKLNNDRKNQNAYVAQLEKDMVAAQQAADLAAAEVINFAYKAPTRSSKGSSGGSGSSNKTEKRLVDSEDTGSLKFAQDMVNQIKKDLEEMPQEINGKINIDFENAKKKLDSWQKIEEHRKVMIEPEVTLAEGSLEYAEDMLDKAKKALNSIDLELISDADLQLALSQVSTWEKEVEKREIKLGLKLDDTDFNRRLKELENTELTVNAKANLKLDLISDIEKQAAQVQECFDKGAISLEEANAELAKLNVTATQLGQKPIVLKIKTELEKKQEAVEEVHSTFSEIQTQFELGIITQQELINKANECNQVLAKLGAKPIEIDIKTNMDEVLEQMTSAFEQIETGFSAFRAVDGVIGSIGSLSEKLKEGASAWEIFMGVVEVASSVLTTIQAVMTAVNLVNQLFNANTLVGAAAQTSAATASGVKAGADSAQIATTTAATVALKAQEAALLDLAAAQIFAAHAYIPFAGVGIASGLIATMMGVMTAQKAASLTLAAFADGGVVRGSQFHGDNVLIRANAGETVLTQKQSADLYHAIKSGQIGGNALSGEIKIKGSDLYVALNNYNSKMGKIRR